MCNGISINLIDHHTNYYAHNNNIYGRLAVLLFPQIADISEKPFNCTLIRTWQKENVFFSAALSRSFSEI